MNAFNHASAAVGDVVWAGQSTRHIRAALEVAGLTQERVRALWAGVSPMHYYDKFVETETRDQGSGTSRTRYAAEFAKKVLLIYAQYDLTFPLEYSLEVVRSFDEHGIAFEKKVLPCGHYTTGETPFQYLDGWWMGSFVYRAFKALREEAVPAEASAAASEAPQVEEELAQR